MRFVVTALAVALATVFFAGCSHDKTLKESPEEIAKEQAAADAHNANTVPSAGDDETPSSDAPAATTTTQVEYGGGEGLRVGDCIDLPTPNTASVRAVPCDRPHHAEVTARVDVGARFPDGAPSQADYDRIMASECKAAFDSYVRQPPPAGVYSGGYTPSPESWYMDYRIVTCAAVADRDGNVLTGSLRKPG